MCFFSLLTVRDFLKKCLKSSDITRLSLQESLRKYGKKTQFSKLARKEQQFERCDSLGFHVILVKLQEKDLKKDPEAHLILPPLSIKQGISASPDQLLYCNRDHLQNMRPWLKVMEVVSLAVFVRGNLWQMWNCHLWKRQYRQTLDFLRIVSSVPTTVSFPMVFLLHSY